MKKLFLALIILIAFGVSASAQVPTPFSLYAGGAISLPQSPTSFSDGFKNGIHGMIGFGWKLMPSLQAVAKAELHSFGVDFEKSGLAASNPNLSGGTNRIWMFGVDGRYSLGLPAAPLKPSITAAYGIASRLRHSAACSARSVSLLASGRLTPWRTLTVLCHAPSG